MAEIILNVDDFDPQRYARSALLRAAGFEVIEARTGRQALALVEQHRPRLVLLDVHLPDIDGLAVCREIKANSATATTLVLHVSASFRDAGIQAQALENGADGYLPEPVEGAVLLAHIRSLLRLGEAEASARESAAAFKRLADNSPDAVARLDRQYRYLYLNTAWEQTTGDTADASLGRGQFPSADTPHASCWFGHYERVCRSRQAADFECEVETALGPRVFEARVVPECGAAGVESLLVITRDVTEQRRADREARRQRELLQQIFDNIPVMLVLWDPHLQRFTLNRHAETVLGWTTEEARDGDFMAKVYPDPAYRQQVTEYMRALEPGWRAVNTTAKDGVPIPCEWANVRLADDTMIGIGVDVRAREEAQRALRQSEERYRSLVESSPEAVFINRDDRVAYMNSAALVMFGADSPEALVGQPVLSLFHPDSWSLVQSRIERLRRGQSAPLVEERVVRRDGAVREAEVAAAPCYFEGSPGIQVVLRDITDRKRAEARTRRQTAVIGGIARIFKEALTCETEEELGRSCLAVAEEVTQSEFGFVGEVNPETGLLDDIAVSYTPPALEGMYTQGRGPVGLEIHGVYGRVLNDGRGFFTNEPAAHPDSIGTPPGHASLTAFLGVPLQHRGRIVGMVGVANRRGGYSQEDLEAMEALAPAIVQAFVSKRAERALREANRVKDDFLATLSHELRTPLTAILGWAHLLNRGGLDEAMTRQALESIARNAEAQRQLINDVLDVSRMVTGKLRLELRDVDLAETLVNAVESIRPATVAKGIRVDIDAAVADAVVTADPDRLQQVAWNLLANAVKFTPAGGSIHATVRCVGQHAELSISDNGIGIAAEFLPHVFDRFAQADTSMSRRHTGLGLGLSIVRQLVELHGGRVAAESAGEGKGAVFTVTLPLRTEASAQAARAAAGERGEPEVDDQASVKGIRVLVVEDADDARVFVGTLLREAGAEVTEAASGQEALAAVMLARPDVIVADIGMPEMDGLEVVRRIRKLPEAAGGQVPIIALSAYGSREDRLRAFEAGFSEHIVKPVVPDVLVRAVKRAALRQTSSQRLR